MPNLRLTWAQSIWMIFFIGMVVRVISLNYSFGPQSLDDYRHALFPALQWMRGDVLNIPPYRSHLLVWWLGFWFYISKGIGFTEPLSLLKTALLGIHLLSIAFPVGVYYFMRRKMTSIPWLMLICFCLNPILIFTSSRFLGESVSAPFLFLGLAMIYDHRKESNTTLFFSGLLLVGIATLLRFQIGVVYLLVIAISCWEKKWRDLVLILKTGLVILILQAGVDFFSGKPFLGSLLAYLEINKNGGAEFGVIPWYSTWMLFFACLFLPFSLPLIWRGWRYLVDMKWWVVITLWFVFVHSMIPHKEERFLFPIVPLCLFFILLLIFQTPKNRFSKYVFLPLFAVINFVFIILGLFSNSQGSVVDPIASLRTENENILVLEAKPKFGVYGLREFFLSPTLKYLEFPGDADLSNYLKSINGNSGFSQIVILSEMAEKEYEFPNGDCSKPEKFQSLSDKVIYYMNAGANYRRAPTWRRKCVISEYALKK